LKVTLDTKALALLLATVGKAAAKHPVEPEASGS
jgi:hypothetical protein